LLAHAKVDVIGWNGTSSGWLGFEADVRLCEQITAATGIPATTSMLALNEILEHQKVKRLGYVTPYLDDVQAKILENYEKLGFACQGERHLGLQDNFSFSEVPVVQLEDMTRDVAKEKPDAITIICTNLRVAPSAAKLERETGIPVYDTIATVVWKCLKMAGVDTKRVTQWGSLFQQV
jgi:maleate isomerase